MLEPSSPGVYPDIRTLLEVANLHARHHRYAVVKQCTKSKEGNVHKVYLHCDWGGKYKDKANPGIRTF